MYCTGRSLRGRVVSAIEIEYKPRRGNAGSRTRKQRSILLFLPTEYSAWDWGYAWTAVFERVKSGGI